MSGENPESYKGYRLELAGDIIGKVVTVVPRTKRASSRLIVHSEPASCGLAAVPLDEIETIDHQGRRLVLHDQPLTSQQLASSGARARPSRA